MTEKLNYQSIEESVLQDAWERMAHAKLSGDTVAYGRAKADLRAGLKAIGNAAPQITRKYVELLGEES